MLQWAIGIMQGRLSAPEEGRFQSFPRNSWRQEFARAQKAGLAYIEWIYDDYGSSANPISSQKGREELGCLKAESGIDTPAICADWLMDFPLIRCDAEDLTHRECRLHQLLHWGKGIAASRLVLPFVDGSAMRNQREKDIVLGVLERALLVSEETGVEMHLEADLGPDDFSRFLAHISHPMIKVNYDTGNSSGLGFVASEEFAAYGDRIGSIHIKDRLRRPDGTVETRPLGQGSANFADVFASIHKIGYSGGFTLQVARGEDGDEVNWAKQQAAFVRSCLT
jgi:L-ribulose-5-phosphate 3-epimerase